MTNAATGNPMIPSHPGISAQHAAAGTPTTPSASNPSSEQPNQSFDMDWAALAMNMEDEEGNPPSSSAAPNGQQQPQGQPPQAQQPQQMTPEQMEAIARANMEGQPQQQPQPPGQQVPQEQLVSQAETHLLNNLYKLTDEQKKQLISEPDVAIPQLAARMHVQIATTLANYMQQAMHQMVPQMALSAMNKQMGAFRAEQAFFGTYPALRKPEFRSVVLQSLKLAKAYNPNATRDQVMKDAAELAAYKLKVNLGQPQPQQPQQQQVRQPMTPAQMPPQQQMPFMPAPPGGASAASAQPGQQQDNIFEQLASDTDW